MLTNINISITFLVSLFLLEFGNGASILQNRKVCSLKIKQQTELKRFDDSCYYSSKQAKADYEGAELYCEGHGGHLTSIMNKKMQRFLMSEFRKLQYDGKIWIGLSDKLIKGHLTWGDGTEMTYSNFAEGQERESLNDITTAYRHCVAMDTVSGLWYIHKCRKSQAVQRLPYMCQFPTAAEITERVFTSD